MTLIVIDEYALAATDLESSSMYHKAIYGRICKKSISSKTCPG